VTAVAASPGPPHPQQIAVAVQNAGGCAVEEQPSGQTTYSKSPLAGSAGPCTSLSYDADGNLWAAAGSGVWVLQPNRAPAAVDLSAISADLQPGDQIQALRMAPDAVRAALLVKSSAGNRLLLVAVQFHGANAVLGQPVTVGSSLTNPLAVSWYDSYHLAVLTGDGIYEVPLTGGAGPQPAPQLLSLAPTGAQALTTDGSELVVGTSQGSVAAETVSAPGWLYVPNASNPIYPG
jgi:hypothetical protein